jgi:periplasmic divalent cation tolerance protein
MAIELSAAAGFAGMARWCRPEMESLLALSTFPDQEIARTTVRALVEKGLVACGNILPGIESIYRWQGKIESGSEALVLFKLSASNYDAFERELRSLHPYDVPELIAFPIERGSADYLKWIAENSAAL